MGDIYVEGRVTQAALVAAARERFGDDPLDWAFVCPTCGDVATGRDFGAVLEARGSDKAASDVLGQECIGRWTKDRGCDWCAYGLFRGPVFVVVDGREVPAFRLAEAS